MTVSGGPQFDELCPSSMAPLRMANKWAPLVLRSLSEGALRFTELRAIIYRTSSKELARALRGLERGGFVVRNLRKDAPTYELTSLGQSLFGVLTLVYAWTDEHWDELLRARDADD